MGSYEKPWTKPNGGSVHCTVMNDQLTVVRANQLVIEFAEVTPHPSRARW